MAQVGKSSPRRGLPWNGRGVVAIVLALGMAVGLVAVALAAFSPRGVEVRRADGRSQTTSSAQTLVESGVGTDDGQSHPPQSATATAAPSSIFVHVDGAVAVPGVYELTASARANDAVVAAGGLSAEADTSAINLAAPLVDGDKLHIPRVGEDASAGAAPGSSQGGTTAQGGSALSERTGSGAAGAADSGSAETLVNINSASVEELDSLPGVGPSTAAAIVEDRDANGPFTSPEDLMRVSGIGEKKFEKLKGRIRV